MQPTSNDVEVFVEGLLQPPNELAVLYPGCSQDSRVVVDLADSSLFNVTMVSLDTELDTYIDGTIGDCL